MGCSTRLCCRSRPSWRAPAGGCSTIPATSSGCGSPTARPSRPAPCGCSLSRIKADRSYNRVLLSLRGSTAAGGRRTLLLSPVCERQRSARRHARIASKEQRRFVSHVPRRAAETRPTRQRQRNHAGSRLNRSGGGGSSLQCAVESHGAPADTTGELPANPDAAMKDFRRLSVEPLDYEKRGPKKRIPRVDKRG